ncbi:hypothetical protein NEIG_01699 [Nematocida sp. ERTm5]|nr:hypothetical protein NEIRO02_1175 [Nematocida sp. AWRm79]KAI5183455.1 hypothetical protein NEIRO03_1050 [Nematocida sp. AWRm78]OAG32382.1 hypothetical protein NEIG_01699 [Nematocida sp. ERTm5]
MVVYKVRNLLDITQPLLNHEERKNIPEILKAVVEVLTPEFEKNNISETSTNQVRIVYIETNGKEIGVNTIFECQNNKDKVINISKTKIHKSTQYKVDKELINTLLSKTRKSKT